MADWMAKIKKRPSAVKYLGDETIWVSVRDYNKLIAALEVAEDAIRHYARNEFANDWSRIDYAKYILAQLQSGEFPSDCDMYKPCPVCGYMEHEGHGQSCTMHLIEFPKEDAQR